MIHWRLMVVTSCGCENMDTKPGLFLVMTDDSQLISTLSGLKIRGTSIRLWCSVRARAVQTELLGGEDGVSSGVDGLLMKGDITKPGFLGRWVKENAWDQVCVLVAFSDLERHGTLIELVLTELPQAKILSLMLGHRDEHPRKFDKERILSLSWAELLLRPLNTEVRHVQAAHHVKAVRDVLDAGDRIALLLQPDPDPDGLASALALRTLLGRNKVSTPIVSFGRVTRPENRAMMRLLDLELTQIKPEDLNGFDRVVLLDTQPSHLGCELPRVDVVIDHHPNVTERNGCYLDIRPYYGSTSTILIEYLRAAAMPVGQRLATALVYGIKSDTLFLNREVIDADLDAFVSLYPDINYNLLRRIEKPELPIKFAPVLAQALQGIQVENGLLVSCLGNVSREDLIPQIADFLLHFEDVEWVVCVGVFENQVIMSVRNVGYVKNAGDVVKRVIGNWGLGGGHRTMAKALFPVPAWTEHFGGLSCSELTAVTFNLFLKEIL